MKKRFILPLLFLAPLIFSCSENSTSESINPNANSLSAALEYSKNHSFGIEGDVATVYANGTEEYDIDSFSLHNVFDTGILSSTVVYHYNLNGSTFDDEYSATYFAKDDGYTYQRGLTLQNKVVDEPVKGKSSDKVKFDDNFSNPFEDIRYADMIKLDDGYLIKPQKSTAFSTAITQRRMVAKKTILTIKDGKFDSLLIYTDSSSTIVSGVYASYRFELFFNWDEKGAIPDIKPYDHEKEHDALESALFNINRKLSNDNFTATTELTIDGSTSTGKFYATKEAVYSDATDSSGKTYGVKNEGTSYYEFAVSTNSSGEQQITVYDEDPISKSDVYPSYNAFAAEMFMPGADGLTFTAHTGADTKIIKLIAPYTEASYYATYITKLEIHLNTDKSFKELYFEYYDYQNNINAKATISYDDIDTTELPIEL